MRNKIISITLALLCFACATHNIFASDLRCNWTGNNPPNTVDYVVQRQVGANWVDVQSTKAETLTITNVAPGTWVLRVVARAGTAESAPSNVVTLDVKPNAPTIMTVTFT